MEKSEYGFVIMALTLFFVLFSYGIYSNLKEKSYGATTICISLCIIIGTILVNSLM